MQKLELKKSFSPLICTYTCGIHRWYVGGQGQDYTDTLSKLEFKKSSQ